MTGSPLIVGQGSGTDLDSGAAEKHLLRKNEVVSGAIREVYQPAGLLYGKVI